MSDDKFDVLIVGAGPAGVSAAITAARAGLQTVVLERGAYPGAKNVQGAILYTKMLADVLPEFWRDPACPLERFITKQNFMLAGEDAAAVLGYHNERWTAEPHNCYSIIRVKFDQWYAKKAEEAGADIYSGVTVRKLIRKEGGVIGIETSEGDQLFADVVIACDGVNSMLAQSAGLMDEWRPDEVALGVKEVLELPRGRIEDRFQLEGNEGATYEIFGDITKGMLGYAFLYTNRDSLAFGVGCKLSHFHKTRIRPYELLESVKRHPTIRRMVSDAKPLEYSAHLIPEGGYHAMPPLFADGFMIAGDAAQMINPTHREGSNMAMAAGRMAAETAIEAKAAGDFSAKALSAYQRRLEGSFILRDMKKIADIEPAIERHMDIINLYPKMACRALYDFFTVDGRPKSDIRKAILSAVRKEKSVFGMAKDAWALRNMF